MFKQLCWVLMEEGTELFIISTHSSIHLSVHLPSKHSLRSSSMPSTVLDSGETEIKIRSDRHYVSFYFVSYLWAYYQFFLLSPIALQFPIFHKSNLLYNFCSILSQKILPWILPSSYSPLDLLAASLLSAALPVTALPHLRNSFDSSLMLDSLFLYYEEAYPSSILKRSIWEVNVLRLCKPKKYLIYSYNWLIGLMTLEFQVGGHF